MKMLLTLLTLLTLYTLDLFAQWQPDVRLTNDPAASNTSFNNAWSIAASGNSVHVAWHDIRDGNNEIYYKRSTDGGVSWGIDRRLTNNSAFSRYPSVSVSGLLVHVVWEDDRDGNYEIYYKRSTDGGISWGADTRLINNFAYSLSPAGAVSGSLVHVVWYEDRDANNEIYYKRSTDGGVSWGADTRLTSNSANSYGPSVSVSGSVVNVVWQDNRDGNYEIYYKRSTDGGVSWGAETRLTNNPAFSRYPSGSISGSVVHVVWEDYRDGHFDAYYKRSTDGGISWGADTRLTNNSSDSYHPNVSVSSSPAEDGVHVVWYDNRDGNSEIYYKRSTDAGISWEADTRLTINSAGSHLSSVSVSGQAVHVVWRDIRDGNYEIYYKRDPTGNLTSSSLTLNLTAFIQGFYNPVSNNMISDTARVYLRNSSSPYNSIDSSKGVLSSTGSGTFLFSNAVNGLNYYLEVEHRNSIETWSSSGNVFSSGTLTYNFSTISSQSYGSNEIQVDASPVRFAIYSGDVNQDGTVDIGDNQLIDNDSYNFVSGYIATDVNGDGTVDIADATIADNNAFNFVSKITP